MSTPDSSAPAQPACRNLRSKEMYYQSAGQPDDLFSSGICWCAKTQDTIGPDGAPVGPLDCCTERKCYLS